MATRSAGEQERQGSTEKPAEPGISVARLRGDLGATPPGSSIKWK